MLSQLICFLKNLLWLIFNLISRWFRSEDKVLTQNLDVLIVGAGISGIAVAKVIIRIQCTAVLHVQQSITPLLPTQKLQDVGVRSYRILEAGAGVGGTWHWNQYPGVACDVPAHAYSFSWRPNPSWSSSFPGAQEIQVAVASE